MNRDTKSIFPSMIYKIKDIIRNIFKINIRSFSKNVWKWRYGNTDFETSRLRDTFNYPSTSNYRIQIGGRTLRGWDKIAP